MTVVESTGRPIAGMPYRFRHSLDYAAKRPIDLMGAAALLVASAPILACTALAIKLDSRGPVFFKPTRVGKDGREFVMYKFRTMVVDAEARLADLQHLNLGGAYMIKIAGDPRVTRVGRFLRISSIDELPQLLNVLRGEMSLIGPRPQAPNEVALYTEEQRRRLDMKPGITGWWQVNARHEPSFEQMMACDMTYIARASILFDLRIVRRTIWLILSDIFGLLSSRRRPSA